jgi:uncharacterized SAM-binding protein YcdF (DUF218 family)
VAHHLPFHIRFPHPPRLSWRARSLLILFLAFSTYALGFAVYVVSLPKPFTLLPDDLEGLATFTGGSGRVEAAMKAAQRGFEGPILISGSNQGTRLSDILARTSAQLTDLQKEHIAYDIAQTTRENVTSLAAWAGYYNLDNIGVITSTYHVPRVRLLALLHARHLQLTFLPVQPADSGLRPLIREYNKLLATPFLR